MEKDEFAGKTVIVTGSGAGLGRAISRAFAREGANVVVVDLDAEAGRENEQYIKEQFGAQVLFVEADVSKDEDVKRLVETTISTFGGVDVLINNAGVSWFGSMFEDNAVDLFDRVMAINVRGPYLCAKHVVEQAMKKSGKGGAIVNIASTRALQSEPNTEAYSASKGAVLGLTHSMAVSLGEFGIRVNSICPGWIEVRDWQKAGKAQQPTLDETDHKQHPAGRVGRPDDIAEACLFLSDSRKSGFMTGQNMVIDGGMTKKMIYSHDFSSKEEWKKKD